MRTIEPGILALPSPSDSSSLTRFTTDSVSEGFYRTQIGEVVARWLWQDIPLVQ